jgi:hypothetical protein
LSSLGEFNGVWAFAKEVIILVIFNKLVEFRTSRQDADAGLSGVPSVVFANGGLQALLLDWA